MVEITEAHVFSELEDGGDKQDFVELKPGDYLDGILLQILLRYFLQLQLQKSVKEKWT